jgi:hypothetical protein
MTRTERYSERERERKRDAKETEATTDTKSEKAESWSVFRLRGIDSNDRQVNASRFDGRRKRLGVGSGETFGCHWLERR